MTREEAMVISPCFEVWYQSERKLKMTPSMIRRKVEEEIARIPDESIEKLYDLVHRFRLRPQPADDTDRIMSLAGSWADMAEEDYASFVEEVEERRHQAGAGRRFRATGFD